MSQKTNIVAGATLLAAGVAAFFLTQHTKEQPAAAATDRPKHTPTPSSSGTGISATGDAATRQNRTRAEAKYPDLSNKYGESRTNLSKHVTENVVGLLEDALQMQEMARSMPMPGMGGGMGLGRVGNELNLTDAQREKSQALIADFQKRQADQSKETIERLKKDPSSMMQLMLANDAFSRGEIDEAEVKRLQSASGENLTELLNPMRRGGNPMQDETFVKEFKSTLDPAQQETLQASIEAQADPNPANPQGGPNAQGGPFGNLANTQAMDLEKLDTTVQSVQKLSTGIKSMMEGFGGLQNMNPNMGQPQPGQPGQR